MGRGWRVREDRQEREREIYGRDKFEGGYE
jgi:hypothetical protein